MVTVMVMVVSADYVAPMGMDWVLEMDPEETKYLWK